MREQGVLVPNLAEAVDPIRARGQHRRDQVYRHVSSGPAALFAHGVTQFIISHLI